MEEMETNEEENQNKDEEVKEGKHMQLLSDSLNLTVKKFLSGVKLSMFKSSFKPIYKQQPEALKKIHQQVTKQLESNINEEILQMFKEENIVALMNQLDETIQNQNGAPLGTQETTVQAWRQTGQPELDILAHSVPVKEKEKGHLEHVVEELEKQNKLLKDALKARQKKLFDTKQKIDKHVETWEQIASVSENMPKEMMQNFINK